MIPRARGRTATPAVRFDSAASRYTAVTSPGGYGWTGDVIGLRRALGLLDQMVAAGYRIEPFAEQARGVPDTTPGFKLAVMAAFADTLVAARDLDGATAVARDAFAMQSAHPEIRNEVISTRIEIALARAEVARDRAAALARLDRIDAGVAATNPGSATAAAIRSSTRRCSADAVSLVPPRGHLRGPARRRSREHRHETHRRRDRASLRSLAAIGVDPDREPAARARGPWPDVRTP